MSEASGTERVPASPAVHSPLSALVSARLCHDLISPMGAIGNGLELLQMSEGAGKAELALINDSLRAALAKLRFYRIAFGPADLEGRQSFEEAAQITDAMYGGRFAVQWEGAARDMPRTSAKLIYLAILCLEKSLPMGGTAQVRFSDPEGRRVSLETEGRRTAPPADLWAHVIDGTPLVDLRSDGVQFALLRQALECSGHRLAAHFAETGVTIDLDAPHPLAA